MSLIPSTWGWGRRSNIFDPFSLDVWDPFFDLPFTTPSLIPSTATSLIPSATAAATSVIPRSETAAETLPFANVRIDWRETPEAHVFRADIPGVRKDEVKVEVEEGNLLRISGQRTREKEEKTDTWHRVERSSGQFLRRFRLPENAKVDQVKASLENGVLTVTVPKTEVQQPQVKQISVS